MDYKASKIKNGIEIYRVLETNTETKGKVLRLNESLKITSKDHPLTGIVYYQGIQNHPRARIFEVSEVPIS